MPAPLLPEEAQRLEALHAYDVLDTPPEAAFERVTALAARFFGVPISLVSLVDGERQWFKSVRGLDLCETSRDVSFCAHTIQRDETLVIPDVTLDPRFADNPLVTGQPGIRFYAGAPLRTSAGHRLGSLCIIDTLPRPAGLDDTARGTLADLAATVVEALELRLALRRTREARAESERAGHGWRASEARYAAILETVPDCLLTIDHEGTILDHNQAAARTFGREDGSLPGARIHEILLPPSLDPKGLEGAAPIPGTLPAYLGAGEGGTSARHVEIPARHADGHLVLCELSVTRIPVEGLPQFTVSLRDISTRRAEADRLRMLESSVDHANDAILITEAEPFKLPGPRIIYANRSFLQSTGYRLEEILGKTPRILQGPNTSEDAKVKIRRALERWQPVRQEILNYRKDGSEFWVELNIVPVANEQGWYTHWVSVQRDVTARKATETLLNQAKEAAEAADQAKSEFLSRMSHELRTPLNAVLGFGQLVEMQSAPGITRERAGHIVKAGHHLLALINEVLDISCIESGHLSFSLETVGLADVLGEALDLIQPLAERRGITVELEPDAADVQRVVADRQRLKQVFLNLLSNAVKYNRPGGRIRVTCAPANHAGEAPGTTLPSWRVSVSDDGPGIPEEKRGRLFLPFERLGAEHSGIAGTGLGLALSRRLIEAMGGQIGLESDDRSGATFWVELPAGETGREHPVTGAPEPQSLPGRVSPIFPAISPRPPSPVFPASRPGSPTVLMIEDNLSNQTLVEHLLADRRDLRLLAAMQGRLGLDLARRHRPDLILLDVHLPDMAGWEVLAHLQTDVSTAGIPVVVISADATRPPLDRLMAAGARAYLTKPLDVNKFFQTLRDLLGVDLLPVNL